MVCFVSGSFCLRVGFVIGPLLPVYRTWRLLAFAGGRHFFLRCGLCVDIHFVGLKVVLGLGISRVESFGYDWWIHFWGICCGICDVGLGFGLKGDI